MGTTIVPPGATNEGRLKIPRSRSHADQSDHQLIAATSDRDPLALAELFDRHGKLAYGIAVRVTRDPMCAQDAVQDAFVQLWCNAATIDLARTSAAAWIALLARRRAIDITRREASATRVRVVTKPELATRSAEEHALISVESRRARAALAALTPDQRTVIELAYFRGLSQSEIAKTLTIPLGTVKSRTFTALAGLRAHLNHECQAKA